MSLNVNLLAFDVMLSLSISTVEHIIANKVIIIVRDIFGSFDNFFIAYDVIAKECKKECEDIFYRASKQEKDWARYLFKEGSMIGLNKEILYQYVEYITNIRMKSVGLDAVYPHATQNPIPWINTWLVSDNVQVAPQEVELSSYLVGQIDSQVDTNNLEDFEL